MAGKYLLGRVFSVILSLFIIVPYAYSQAKVKGIPVFAVYITDVALTPKPAKPTGFFFNIFLDKWNTRVACFDVVNGDTIERESFGGFQAQAFLTQLDSINFIGFDFEAEASAAESRMFEDRKRQKLPPVIPIDDGAGYAIEFTYKQTAFKMRRWNPANDLTLLAGYSPRIAQLNKVISLFAAYYGRAKFGL